MSGCRQNSSADQFHVLRAARHLRAGGVGRACDGRRLGGWPATRSTAGAVARLLAVKSRDAGKGLIVIGAEASCFRTRAGGPFRGRPPRAGVELAGRRELAGAECALSLVDQRCTVTRCEPRGRYAFPATAQSRAICAAFGGPAGIDPRPIRPGGRVRPASCTCGAGSSRPSITWCRGAPRHAIVRASFAPWTGRCCADGPLRGNRQSGWRIPCRPRFTMLSRSRPGSVSGTRNCRRRRTVFRETAESFFDAGGRGLNVTLPFKGRCVSTGCRRPMAPRASRGRSTRLPSRMAAWPDTTPTGRAWSKIFWRSVWGSRAGRCWSSAPAGRSGEFLPALLEGGRGAGGHRQSHGREGTRTGRALSGQRRGARTSIGSGTSALICKTGSPGVRARSTLGSMWLSMERPQGSKARAP